MRWPLMPHMPEGFDIMLGNGSDELISLLALACAVPPSSANGFKKASVLAPGAGFCDVRHERAVAGTGLSRRAADRRISSWTRRAMLAAIDQHQPAITYLAYPNNPTANLWDDAVIESVIEAAGAQGGLVVMDEAYQPFSSKSYIDRLARHHHVLLMRTLSKFGLAGVRLGYMMGRQRVDRRDRQGAPALQHQRAELRVRPVCARTPGSICGASP